MVRAFARVALEPPDITVKSHMRERFGPPLLILIVALNVVGLTTVRLVTAGAGPEPLVNDIWASPAKPVPVTVAPKVVEGLTVSGDILVTVSDTAGPLETTRSTALPAAALVPPSGL